MPRIGETTWDQTVAKALYDRGETFQAIGRKVGVSDSMLYRFAARHWPKRKPPRIAAPPGPPRPPAAHPLRPGASTLEPLASLQEPIHVVRL